MHTGFGSGVDPAPLNSTTLGNSLMFSVGTGSQPLVLQTLHTYPPSLYGHGQSC